MATVEEEIQFSLFTFSGSAPLAGEDQVSHLYYTAPVAPHVVRDVSPTITRRFYAEAHQVKREASEEGGGRDRMSAGSFVELPSASRPTSRATTPRSRSPSPPESSRSSSVAPRRGGSRASAGPPSFPPDNWAELLPPSSGVTTRSQTRSTLKVNSAHSTPGIPSDIGLKNLKYSPEAFTVELRHPVQERKCQRTDDEKERNIPVGEFKTRWYESCGTSTISTPPSEIAKHRDLQLGDLFCHWTHSSSTPTMWLWCASSDNRLAWLPVSLGHPRLQDSRRLGLTDNHRPSWVREVWFRKKLASQNILRGNSERLSEKVKGKQKAV